MFSGRLVLQAHPARSAKMCLRKRPMSGRPGRNGSAFRWAQDGGALTEPGRLDPLTDYFLSSSFPWLSASVTVSSARRQSSVAEGELSDADISAAAPISATADICDEGDEGHRLLQKIRIKVHMNSTELNLGSKKANSSCF